MFRKLVRLFRATRSDALALLLAMRHPGTPPVVKLGVLLLALYVVSPFDAITDLMPFAGWVDDLALLAFAVPWLLARVPAGVHADVQSRMASWRARWRATNS